MATTGKKAAGARAPALRAHRRLKARHRTVREEQEENLAIRVHRSLSWLKRAANCKDIDGKMIFFWIAFNAAYAKDPGPELEHTRRNEPQVFKRFFRKLCNLDKDDKIYSLVWGKSYSSIEALLENQYISYDFWEYQRGNIAKKEWISRARKTKKQVDRYMKDYNRVKTALGQDEGDRERDDRRMIKQSTRSTPSVLSIVFSRIYVLRNQLMHGGATWNGKVNREQLRDCVRFMEKFVIAMLEILVDDRSSEWDDVTYPVIAGGEE